MRGRGAVDGQSWPFSLALLFHNPRIQRYKKNQSYENVHLSCRCTFCHYWFLIYLCRVKTVLMKILFFFKWVGVGVAEGEACWWKTSWSHLIIILYLTLAIFLFQLSDTSKCLWLMLMIASSIAIRFWVFATVWIVMGFLAVLMFTHNVNQILKKNRHHVIGVLASSERYFYAYRHKTCSFSSFEKKICLASSIKYLTLTLYNLHFVFLIHLLDVFQYIWMSYRDNPEI